MQTGGQKSASCPCRAEHGRSRGVSYLSNRRQGKLEGQLGRAAVQLQLLVGSMSFFTVRRPAVLRHQRVHGSGRRSAAEEEEGEEEVVVVVVVVVVAGRVGSWGVVAGTSWLIVAQRREQ